MKINCVDSKWYLFGRPFVRSVNTPKIIDTHTQKHEPKQTIKLFCNLVWEFDFCVKCDAMDWPIQWADCVVFLRVWACVCIQNNSSLICHTHLGCFIGLGKITKPCNSLKTINKPKRNEPNRKTIDQIKGDRNLLLLLLNFDDNVFNNIWKWFLFV